MCGQSRRQDDENLKKLSRVCRWTSRDGVLLEKVGSQSANLVLRNGTSKDPFHFSDDGFPHLFGMLGLHVNIIGGMTNQAIGVGHLLSLAGLKGKRIGG